MKDNQSFIGLPFKYLSLITLTLQNSLLAILLHHSRTVSSTKLYSASAAVLLNEILKCLISFIVALYNATRQSAPNHLKNDQQPLLHVQHHSNEENFRSISDSRIDHERGGSPILIKQPSSVFEQDFQDWKRNSRSRPRMMIDHSYQIFSEILSKDCWRLSIPAILYVIQNNLQFVAAANLDVATFSVTYQLKILTTALCSVVMLGRRLSVEKWISLLFLAAGVALVQLQNVSANERASKGPSLETANRLKGFIAVTLACFTSGLAGVYFELVLKSSNKVDLWIRNIQLSLFSLLPALFTTLFTTSDREGHMFSNFGFWAWATVLTQVFGGLVTALVIKFADNILKGFATSLSIILSTLAGVFLFGTSLSIGSAIGSFIVLLATCAYNSSPDIPSTSTPNPQRKGSTLSSPFRKEKERTL